MKKILIMFFLVLTIVAGCTSNNDLEDDSNKQDTIIEPQEEVSDEDTSEGLNPIINDDTVDIAIGLEAPDFTLTNLNGDEVSLSDYRGNIVMLNFWATWCHWCDVEMPDLNNLDKENEDVIVLAVNVMEDEKTVNKYLEDGGYEFEVVFDNEGQIAKIYLVNGLPNSYFIDKDGILQYVYPSMMTAEHMSEIVNAIRDLYD